MSNIRSLYHLIKADFWERVRRNSFLIVVGATILLGYLFLPPRDARYLAGVLPHSSGDTGHMQYFRGLYNSAWIGSMVALMTALLLSLPGFYLVKNCIDRDERTGVGQILATTPLSRLIYILGKWLSNLAVLVFLILILALSSLAMQFIRGEVLEIELWKLLSPFVMIALPVAALVAAMAVFFETTPQLRGSLGNVIYFFLWMYALVLIFEKDLLGWELLFSSVQRSAQNAFPVASHASIGINPIQGPLQTFTWEGVSWTAWFLYKQVAWIGFALGIVLIAALSFNRFDHAPEGLHCIRLRLASLQTSFSLGKSHPALPQVFPQLEPEPSVLRPEPDQVRLPALPTTTSGFRFREVFLAELRLAIKGQRWWWYVVALGLWAGILLSQIEEARCYFYPLAWIWPVFIWSSLGTREIQHNTEALIFSTPHPLRRQFLAAWLAGLCVTVLMGSGIAIRYALTENGSGLSAWVSGAIFIPSLAAALGCWSGSSKLFEVVYTVIWYLGSISKIFILDFMGIWPKSVTSGIYWYYLGSTLLMLGVAILGRRWRLKTM